MSEPRGRSASASRRWEQHGREWRAPASVVTYSREAELVHPSLLRYRAYGRWWETLAALDVTLIVSREYEHLLTAVTMEGGKPRLSFMPMPHPSGIAIDRRRDLLFVASTRNPNQVFTLRPAAGPMPRSDARRRADLPGTLMPVSSAFYPGCLYLHDLALVSGRLHGNAVGQNAIATLDSDGRAPLVWWPRCIERSSRPSVHRNHLQLNSIAAGSTLRSSFFSASTDRMGRFKPGDLRFEVDRRGVIFSGATREPVIRGLTRPHSARLHKGKLWVANSGYGELRLCDLQTSSTRVAAVLPGWTRGLSLLGNTAFVATSRVLPRFKHYAPGLHADRAVCGVHAVNLKTGSIEGGLIWPDGNQVFAVDWMPAGRTQGFPFLVGRQRFGESERDLYYTYTFDIRRLRR